jgi:hypothetical protein
MGQFEKKTFTFLWIPAVDVFRRKVTRNASKGLNTNTYVSAKGLNRLSTI